MPILWVNGTNDFAYPMDSWQKSYRLPASPRTLCLRIRMPHGHGPVGENPEEWVRTMAPFTRHYHLEDIASDRVHKHLIPGHGAIDFGVRHELSFFSEGTRVLHGIMEMGCGTIDLGAGDVRMLDDRIESELLGALGFYTRGNDLWPTPIPHR